MKALFKTPSILFKVTQLQTHCRQSSFLTVPIFSKLYSIYSRLYVTSQRKNYVRPIHRISLIQTTYVRYLQFFNIRKKNSILFEFYKDPFQLTFSIRECIVFDLNEKKTLKSFTLRRFFLRMVRCEPFSPTEGENAFHYPIHSMASFFTTCAYVEVVNIL